MMRWENTREQNARRIRSDAERATARELRRLERAGRPPARRVVLMLAIAGLVNGLVSLLYDDVVIAILIGVALALAIIYASR